VIGILVMGPNASGKTTAVTKAVEPWANASVLTVHGDKAPFNKDQAGESAEAFRAAWRSEYRVVVFEGIDRTARAVAKLQDDASRRLVSVVVTSQRPEVMRAHLRARCEKRGRTFNADYWTDKTLIAEGVNRYANLAKRYRAPVDFIEMDEAYTRSQIIIDTIRTLIRDAVGEPSVVPQVTHGLGPLFPDGY